MKAMILAAGFGTRLRPLTDNLPKALIPLNGRPLLEYVIEHLIRHDIHEIIINVHHLPQMIMDFIQEKNHFGIRIEFSIESDILETGGGIKKAAWFFDDGKPFLVHNVDIITNLNITEMQAFHESKEAVATLAVRERDTTRQLLFSKNMELAGWKSHDRIEIAGDHSREDLIPLSFMGVHIISPEIFKYFPVENHFSIIKAYLDIIRNNRSIRAFRGDKYYWYDVGKPANYQKAERYLGEIRF